jgi:Family of unknown function (DUF6159)
MGRISRGWALAGESWEVLKRDKSLVIFPILSTIFAISAAIAIWVPALISQGVFDGQPVDKHDPVFYVACVATAYVSTFIAIFFNVALAACVVRSMRGEDTKVGEGINAAVQRLGPILGWTLVATTVGLILAAIEARAPQLAARIAARIAGAAWAIATFFVIPVIALEGGGPLRSLKRSAAAVKARWGEGVTGAATIGVVTFLVSLAIAVVGGFGFALLAGAGQHLLAVAFAAIAVIGILVVSLISTALSQIFRVAVYEYAVTGQAPGEFDGQLLQSAFKGKALPGWEPIHGPNQNSYGVDPTTGRPL